MTSGAYGESASGQYDRRSVMSGFSMDSDTKSIFKSHERRAENGGEKEVVANYEELALKALHVDDDPTLNPWTFRMFFLGMPALSVAMRACTNLSQELDCLLSEQL